MKAVAAGSAFLLSASGSRGRGSVRSHPSPTTRHR